MIRTLLPISRSLAALLRQLLETAGWLLLGVALALTLPYASWLMFAEAVR